MTNRTQVPGPISRVFQAMLFVAGSPVEALRWAHHSSQKKHIARYAMPLDKIFPGIANTSIALMDSHELPGEALERDLLDLCLMAKYLRATRILEIGTLYGRTTLNLAMNTAAEAKIYTVDSGTDDAGIGKRHEDVGRKFRNTPHALKITQIIDDSRRLDLKAYGWFDFIFIDGDHRYESVKQDSLNCLQVLSPGGVLAWHDYGLSEDVTAWIDELRDQRGLQIWSLPDSYVAVHWRK
jgi:predicted O-methyltransferase YrrM